MTDLPEQQPTKQLPTPEQQPTGPDLRTGVTTNGLPYPLSTDPLQQGANDIKALALALEARGHGLRVEHGVRQLTPNGAGEYTFFFTTPFAAAPSVVMCSTSASTGLVPMMAAKSSGISASAVTGYGINGLNGAMITSVYYVNYIAVGPA
jgi:hypothetical protein